MNTNEVSVTASSPHQCYPILELPLEIQSNIAKSFIPGEVYLNVLYNNGEPSSDMEIDTDPALDTVRFFSPFLLEETDRHIFCSWKIFNSASHFAEVVQACESTDSIRFAVGDAEPRKPTFGTQLHGLSKVIFDFPSEDYMKFFNVMLPPFDEMDQSMAQHSSMLRRTRHIVLRFNSSFTDPWCDCNDDRWTFFRPGSDPSNPPKKKRKPRENRGSRRSRKCKTGHPPPDPTWNPRFREQVCSHGLVIDWILSFAWSGKYLQHLSSITLEGHMQDWVREKWTSIFERHRREPGFTYDPDIAAIQNRGKTGDTLKDNDWDPAEHFAPRCTGMCRMKCRTLSDRAKGCQGQGKGKRGWGPLEDNTMAQGTWFQDSMEEKERLVGVKW
ncbi:hypothetical protein K504DRAFT_447972 [Pleomassaria siparia CBS 279.74]|uniref:Uncharacterized protein n=1 Tax=Pleomassaria siparia CBS 279.74 TaxID=1314801 RepID=A0A6G1K073_9PLEO|nr:hypothetical protein K504DRAFT_447972 [Pleomassaria siparia CBS 279.74]